MSITVELKVSEEASPLTRLEDMVDGDLFVYEGIKYLMLCDESETVLRMDAGDILLCADLANCDEPVSFIKNCKVKITVE